MAAMAVIIGIIIVVDNGGSVTAADSSISLTSDDGDGSAAVGSLLARTRDIGVFRFITLARRNRIGAGKPAIEVDVGATGRAERIEPGTGGLAADRARLEADSISHPTMIVATGPASTRRDGQRRHFQE